MDWSKATPSSPCQRRIFLLLSAATFFDDYDLIAITPVLPDLRTEFEISKSAGGLLVDGVDVGAIPLLLVSWSRCDPREPRRFSEQVALLRSAGSMTRTSNARSGWRRSPPSVWPSGSGRCSTGSGSAGES